jgi:hypothetical protein
MSAELSLLIKHLARNSLKNTPSPHLRLHIAMACVCTLTLITTLRGQEALRSAVDGDRSYQLRSSPDYLPENNRLHAGPVEFQAHVSFGVEWNDNIFIQPDGRQHDFIHRPQVDLLALWPATDTSRLNLGLGLGYEVYMDHSDLNGLVLTPNSEFALDIGVKDFVFTFYDRFSFSRDVLTQGTLNSGTAKMPRIENTGGLRMRWNPSRYAFELGYGHYNFISVGGGGADFDYLTRSAELLFARAGYRFAEATTAGLEASASLTDYKSSAQSDNLDASIGPFLEWSVTRALTASLRGGLVFHNFDSSPSRPVGTDLRSYYFGLEAQHQLTDHIRHGLSFRRDVQQGLNEGGDYIEQFSTRYSLTWAFHRSASLAADFLYENNNEPENGVANRSHRLGGGLALTVQPLDHVQVSVDYHITTRDSDLPANDYDQNSVTVSATYQF